MLAEDLLHKIKTIEIKAKGLSNQIFSGEYHSAFKGKGMSFSEVREYMHGDDVRTIDWNVTARYNDPYVKVYEEERELSVILLIDISASEFFGSKELKTNFITELSAVLAFSAAQNNDKIGVVFFSDKVEKFIPPKKGKQQVLRIIRDILEFKPQSKGTDISVALHYLTNAVKKRSTVFLISDFLDTNFNDAIRIANKKHDVIALNVFDPKEKELPSIGLLKMSDKENGKEKWINTSSKNTQLEFKKWWLKHDYDLKTIFTQCGVDQVNLNTDHSFVLPLMTLFKKRGY